MYATIRRFEGVAADTIPEVMRRVEEGLLPKVSAIPGFVAYYALPGVEGVIASVTLFDDRAGAEAASQVYADPSRQKTARELLPVPHTTVGEVLLHRGGSATGSSS